MVLLNHELLLGFIVGENSKLSLLVTSRDLASIGAVGDRSDLIHKVSVDYAFVWVGKVSNDYVVLASVGDLSSLGTGSPLHSESSLCLRVRRDYSNYALNKIYSACKRKIPFIGYT